MSSSADDTDSVSGPLLENEFVLHSGSGSGGGGAGGSFGASRCSNDEGAVRYQFPISDLLDRNKAMRSEIEVLEKLIADKYDQLMRLDRCDEEGACAAATAAADEDDEAEVRSADTATNNGGDGGDKTARGQRRLAVTPGDAAIPGYVRKLQDVVRTICELEEFTGTDGLNDDVVDEYIRHLERNYEQVLIFGPEATRALNELPKEALKEALEAKRAHDYEKVLFVLKQDGHYSLVLFNGANASFYHYDAANKRHSELAEQIILKLRRHLDAEQLVEVESNSQLGESSLFTVDSMMKIILTADDETKEGVSPVHVLNLPSQPDYLKIIIMSRYIVTKLSQIESIIRAGG